MPTEATLVETQRARESVALARMNPQELIEKAITAGAAIETLERLLAMAKEVRDLTARDAWYEAMAAFQAECPPIYKDKTASIRTRTGGSYSYKFAGLDAIKPKIDPILGKHGLSARWTTPAITKDAVTVECIVSHALGHSESSGAVTMPIVGGGQPGQGEDGSGANPMQRVAIAMAYAKRYSLNNILGLAPEEDNDGVAGNGKAVPGEEQPGQGGPAAGEQRVISENQGKRLYAIARGTKPTAWTDEQIKALIAEWSYEHVKDIKGPKDYDEIVDVLKKGPGAKRETPAAPQQERLA